MWQNRPSREILVTNQPRSLGKEITRLEQKIEVFHSDLVVVDLRSSIRWVTTLQGNDRSNMDTRLMWRVQGRGVLYGGRG